ncbi:MAG: hypothetical protein PHP01_00855 [Phycisphaerae bacterium]|nr:hypothetical protein [Phycisphaerae bacterium]
MDAMKFIEKLAQKAQGQTVPKYNVSAEVMLRIDNLQQEKVTLLPLELFAGITALAASIVTFFSVQAWRCIVDPLIQLFTPFQGVPLW